MGRRVSLGRAIASIGPLLAGRWPLLLVATLLVGAGLTILGDHLIAPMKGDPGEAATGPAAVAIAAETAVYLVVSVLSLMLTLGILLAPRDKGGGAWMTRRMARAWPVLLLSQTAMGLPPLLAVSLVSATDYGPLTQGAIVLASYVVSWLIYGFIGFMPGTALTDAPAVSAALRGSLRITRGRRLMIFGLNLGIAVASIAGVVVAVVLADLLPGLPEWTWQDEALEVLGSLVATGITVFWTAVFLELRRASFGPGEAAAEVFD